MTEPPAGDASIGLENQLLASLRDAVELFTRLNIPYAMVGGIAAMVYGRARFTDDIDFVAAADHVATLTTHPQIMQACHFDPSSTWKLYHASGFEMDIWKDEFSDQIAARAHEIQFAGQSIRIADVHDLIAMKLRAGRFQDDYDISEILRKTPVNINLVGELVSPAQFDRFQAIQTRLKAQNAP